MKRSDAWEHDFSQTIQRISQVDAPLSEMERRFDTDEERLTDLKFADDIVILAKSIRSKRDVTRTKYWKQSDPTRQPQMYEKKKKTKS